MGQAQIKSVGIVVKPNNADARNTAEELFSWLNARDLENVREPIFTGKELDAGGEAMQVSYTYAYDGRDYPMLGSASYDTLNAVRIDERTVRSEEKRDGKIVGIAVRTVSPDGKVLTITDEGTNRKGQSFSQLLVFDRQ